MWRFILKNKKNSNYNALGIALVVLVVEHLFIREYVGDVVAFFSHLLDHRSLLSVLQWRFETWTSRLLIEAPLIRLSSGMHTFVWAFLDVFMWMLLIWSLMALTDYKHPYLSVAVVFLYPLNQMASAGWMATTMNYLWPLSACAFAFVILRRIYIRQKVGPLLGTLALLALIYATNFETLGIMYLCILTFFSVEMLLQSRAAIKGVAFIGLQYVICFANIGLALMAPGNHKRLIKETSDRMLDFANMTPIDKVVVGFNHTFSVLTDSSFLFLCFSILLIVLAFFAKLHSPIFVCLSAFPAILISLRTFLKPIVNSYMPGFSHLFNSVAAQQRVDATNYFNFVTYIPFIVYAFLLISIMVVIVKSLKGADNSLFLITVLIAGLLTTIAMGFSPTLYASEKRTFLFINFVIMYIIVVLYDNVHLQIMKIRPLGIGLRLLFVTSTVFFVVNNLVSVGATYNF